MEPLAQSAAARNPLNAVLSPEENAAEQIRKIHGDPDRQLTYLTTVADPFSADDRNIDIYADNHDFEYWLSSETGRLIQASPRAGLHQAPHQTGSIEPPNVTELRNKAIDLADRQRPGFRDRLSSFHPFEESRRRALYLFRWELGSTDDGEIPPFMQVGLYADGSLACFTDALN